MAAMELELRTRLFCALVDRFGLMAVGDKTPEELQTMRARDARAARRLRWLLGRPTPGVSFTDTAIDGPGARLPIRIYRPVDAADCRPEPRAVVVVLHGGGWVTGTLDQYDPLATALSRHVPAVVVSVDYRLAPQYPFPAAFEDALAATQWVSDHAAELGADRHRLAVVGDSAGGNLAAAVVLAARDRPDLPIAAQVLVYPVTDLRRAAESAERAQQAPLLTVQARRSYTRMYVRDADPTDPRLSPAAAADLSGLPPTLVQTAEHDPLRADGRDYAAGLHAAAVPVRYTDYLGVPHGFLALPGICRPARQAEWEIGWFLAEQLSPQRAVGAAHR